MWPACHPLCPSTLFSWIFFDPLISGYFLFLLISSRIWNVGTAAAKWDPHVILYVNKVSFLGLSWAPDILSLAFFFRYHAAFETLSKLLANGSRMSSSTNYKSFLSWSYFWPLISSYLPFSFDLLPTLKRWGRCWQVGPTCHPLWTIKVSFDGFILNP